jgi:hypothetical protein
VIDDCVHYDCAANPLLWLCSLQLEWVRACSVSFAEARYIRDSTSGDPLIACGSWQVLAPKSGELVLGMLNRADETVIPPNVVPSKGNTSVCVPVWNWFDSDVMWAEWVIDEPSLGRDGFHPEDEAFLRSIESYTFGMPTCKMDMFLLRPPVSLTRRFSLSTALSAV